MDDEARKRAAHRRDAPEQWVVRVCRLGEEPPLDPLDPTTIDERLALMWPLAIEMWTLSGRSIPAYERRSAPGKIFRRSVR